MWQDWSVQNLGELVGESRCHDILFPIYVYIFHINTYVYNIYIHAHRCVGVSKTPIIYPVYILGTFKYKRKQHISASIAVFRKPSLYSPFYFFSCYLIFSFQLSSFSSPIFSVSKKPENSQFILPQKPGAQMYKNVKK